MAQEILNTFFKFGGLHMAVEVVHMEDTDMVVDKVEAVEMQVDN